MAGKRKAKPPRRPDPSKAVPAFTRQQMSREQILDEVNRLDLMGFSAAEIAEKMRVTRPVIDGDLREIRKRYTAAMQRDREADVRRKVAQLEQVRSQAWDAWEASKRDRRRSVTEYVAAAPAKPGPGGRYKPGQPLHPNSRQAAPLNTAAFKDSMRRLKRVVTVQQTSAESTYLTIITTTLRMEAELLGLFPDMKLQIGARDGGKPALTPAEWMMLAAPLPEDDEPAALPPRVTQAEEAADPVEAEILKMEAAAAANPAGAANGKHQ